MASRPHPPDVNGADGIRGKPRDDIGLKRHAGLDAGVQPVLAVDQAARVVEADCIAVVLPAAVEHVDHVGDDQLIA